MFAVIKTGGKQYRVEPDDVIRIERIAGEAGDDVIIGSVAKDVISAGAGADTITATAGNDVITGGADIDTYSTTEALMIANSGTTATFDGGDGVDIIDFSEDDVVNVVDADFRGFTSVATLTTGDGTNNVVLGTNASAAGIVTVTGGSGADTLDLSAMTNATTVNAFTVPLVPLGLQINGESLGSIVVVPGITLKLS